MLGGPDGIVVGVNAGDVIVLPAGTGHRRLEASPDFLVVGAYPPGPPWDLCRSAPTAEQTSRMRSLPVPDSDPVAGVTGPLTSRWRQPSPRPCRGPATRVVLVGPRPSPAAPPKPKPLKSFRRVRIYG